MVKYKVILTRKKNGDTVGVFYCSGSSITESKTNGRDLAQKYFGDRWKKNYDIKFQLENVNVFCTQVSLFPEPVRG